MSMPKIPDINPDICLCIEDVINLLLSSIALEEIAISNLINAEGEKLNFIFSNSSSCCGKELIDLNSSIEKVLNEICSIETLLLTKLKYVNQIYNERVPCIVCDGCKCENKKLLCGEVINDQDCFVECDIDEKKDQDCNCSSSQNSNMNNSYKKAYNKDLYYKNYNKIINMINKLMK